jgi:hypothetical protein
MKNINKFLISFSIFAGFYLAPKLIKTRGETKVNGVMTVANNIVEKLKSSKEATELKVKLARDIASLEEVKILKNGLKQAVASLEEVKNLKRKLSKDIMNVPEMAKIKSEAKEKLRGFQASNSNSEQNNLSDNESKLLEEIEKEMEKTPSVIKLKGGFEKDLSELSVVRNLEEGFEKDLQKLPEVKKLNEEFSSKLNDIIFDKK